MSCYTRHLGGLFDEAGLENTRQARTEADGRIRRLLNVSEADCPVVWRELKAWLARPDQRARLVAGLKDLSQPVVQE